MEADPDVRLMYSDKYFNISNYADYAKWENICLRRYDVIGIRAAEEARLAAWIDADPARRAEYGDLLANLKKGYEARAEAVREKCYYQETWIRPSDVMMTANRLGTLVDRMRRDGIASVQDSDKNFAGVKSNTRRMMKDFDLATDKEVLTRMMESFTDNVPREMWGEQCRSFTTVSRATFRRWSTTRSKTPACTSYEKLCAWFAQPRTAEEILSDPMAAMANSVSSRRFAEKLKQAEETSGIDADKEELRYTHAIYEMRESEGTPQYPDANSTMRLTYGTVGPVSPRTPCTTTPVRRSTATSKNTIPTTTNSVSTTGCLRSSAARTGAAGAKTAGCTSISSPTTTSRAAIQEARCSTPGAT